MHHLSAEDKRRRIIPAAVPVELRAAVIEAATSRIKAGASAYDDEDDEC